MTSNTEADVNNDQLNNDKESKQDMRTKKSVPMAIRKKRTNFRLRRSLLPKSANMILHELVREVDYVIGDCDNNFTAKLELDGVTYQGTGHNKPEAKNKCAELAIKDIVAKKCVEHSKKVHRDEQGNPLKMHEMEDETPWFHLASLGLHKLFTDWKSQGFYLPQEMLGKPCNMNADESTIENSKKNASSIHSDDLKIDSKEEKNLNKSDAKALANYLKINPVQLLNQLRKNLNFREQVSVNDKGKMKMFTFTVEIDGVDYQGSAFSKKEAKRICASRILSSLYGVVYPDETAKN